MGEERPAARRRAPGDAGEERTRSELEALFAGRRRRGVKWHGTMPDSKVYAENRRYLAKYGDRDGLWICDDDNNEKETS